MDKDLQSRERLLEIAAGLFARKGYAAVSIREIALAAGVNSALISYYFNGKQGLYQAVLEIEISLVLAMLDRLKQTNPDPCTFLRGYAVGLAELHIERPSLLRLISAELTNPTECFESVVRPRIRKIADDITAAIVQGIAAGIFREDINPLLAALQLAGTVNFFFLVSPLANAFLASDGSHRHSRQYIVQAMEVFLSGIRRN
ncbi:MAG: TetR/AcrR family transcriptional regulator [Veillonellaceae bacterium]|nr:TetR/AcrR family transcriptional regulator [Veillonellaceae bacterium]